MWSGFLSHGCVCVICGAIVVQFAFLVVEAIETLIVVVCAVVVVVVVVLVDEVLVVDVLVVDVVVVLVVLVVLVLVVVVEVVVVVVVGSLSFGIGLPGLTFQTFFHGFLSFPAGVLPFGAFIALGYLGTVFSFTCVEQTVYIHNYNCTVNHCLID